MCLYTVELYQRGKAVWKTDIQSADEPKFLFIGPINNAAIWCYRKAGPMLQVLACGQVDRCSAWSTDTVRTDTENYRRTVFCLGDRNYRDQGVKLADLRIVFDADVESGVQSVYQR